MNEISFTGRKEPIVNVLAIGALLPVPRVIKDPPEFEIFYE